MNFFLNRLEIVYKFLFRIYEKVTKTRFYIGFLQKRWYNKRKIIENEVCVMISLQPKQRLRGECTVPPDKSISHRAVLFASIAKGTSEIRNFLPSDDCLSTISCMEELGVAIRRRGDRVQVTGAGLHGLSAPAKRLYAGNSGTTTRLLTGILCGQSFSSEISGDDSLNRRPMARIITPLSRMGAHISSPTLTCPMTVSPGQLHGISYLMPQDSAQVKSAILLAGLYAEGVTSVTERHPSRDHSERMLSAFGCPVERQGTTVTLTPPDQLQCCDVEVVGDISSAAFFLVAGSIVPHSCITVRNVGINPTRTGILTVLQQMGADLTVEGARTVGGEPAADITVRSADLHGVTVGEELIPSLIDEIPILAVAAAFAQGETVISGAQELKVKETNRIDTVCAELSKAGAAISPTPDGMIITGGAPITGAAFDSHGDHRIAMACAVLGLAAETESTLTNAQCASVSFPGFFDLLARF